ncbi:MAG TPA: hypothetical protein VFK70_16305 [Vicinamibacteria bacterium]|nr:hypothetical protein [Vicinamibacteria bacterium]
MRSGLRYLSISSGLSILLSAVGATSVFAQAQAFIYTVTTSAPGPSQERWNVRYDAGYGNDSTDPLGFDGMEQGVTFQGRLRHGFTVRGHVGLGLDSQSTSSSQEVEVLKDLRSASRGIGLSAGLGMRREWEGTGVLFGRLAAGHNFQTSMLFGNVSFERAFEQTRDGVDVITSLGWLRQVGRAVHVGAEALAEDLEGFWDPNEAEGGAKIFAGPSVHVAVPAHSWSLSVCAGPIFYAARNGRTSPAVRPLDARGNGFTARMSFGYSF